MDVQAHFQKVLALCSAYLQKKDAAAAVQVEQLLPDTLRLFEVYTGDTSSITGLLATQHCVLALYNVENLFRPQRAIDHAGRAALGYTSFLKAKGDSISPEEKKNNAAWRDCMTLVKAYCLYQQQDFDGMLALLKSVPASALSTALAGSALCRIALTKDASAAWPAYSTLFNMDRLLQGPDPIDWKYKEDIFRTAYGMLSMLYAKGVPGEDRIPRDIHKALACSYKVHSLLTDKQQKAWVMEDILGYIKQVPLS
ncbi:MAG: hypothetical protein IJP03_02800 [Christensenellaceae bacterium]|nr:hypothetical protein [Christensenellaceae bacterium]